MSRLEASGRPPAITVTTTDYDRLIDLAMAAQRDPATGAFLTEELERAAIVEPGAVPPNVVTMNSHLEFHDDLRDRTYCVTLVYPGEASIEDGKISVLTPIGAALIGLAEGQTISWQTRSGEWHRLTVRKVHFQPEAGNGAGAGNGTGAATGTGG